MKKVKLWTIFNEFEERGEFCIIGTKINGAKNGQTNKFDENDIKQLNKTLEIYRDKRYEIFRYIFVNEDGVINNQLAIRTRIPNETAPNPKIDVLAILKEYAKNTKSRIFLVHNHPSGNPKPSKSDIQTTENIKNFFNSDGSDIYAGHIILDHNFFSYSCPYINNGNWAITNTLEEKENDPLLKKNVPKLLKKQIYSENQVIKIGKEINDTNTWNVKDWIPIFYTYFGKIVGLKYYSCNYIKNVSSGDLKKEMVEVSSMCGANYAFPFVTKENYTQDLENKIINHAKKNCFGNVYLNGKTLHQLGLFEEHSSSFITENLKNNNIKNSEIRATFWINAINNHKDLSFQRIADVYDNEIEEKNNPMSVMQIRNSSISDEASSFPESRQLTPDSRAKKSITSNKKNSQDIIKKQNNITNQEENTMENNIKNDKTIEKMSNLTKEELDYVNSQEFIKKFGDWKKAQRIEKLKFANSLNVNKNIIVNNIDVTDKVNYLRAKYSKENLKELQSIATDIGREILKNYREQQNIDDFTNPKFINKDIKKEFFFQNMSIKEIRHHNIFQKGHIEAISAIPKIIENSIYIGEEDNQDNRNPNLKKFYYFACGIKIDDEDYTCKAVFTLNDKNEMFYDQSLSTIEKGRFVDIINEKNKLDAVNPQQKGWDSNELYERNLNPFDYYDKRLINICQVPQLPFLDENLEPTKEAIQAVKDGRLYITRNNQIEKMMKQPITEISKENTQNNITNQRGKNMENTTKTKRQENELDNEKSASNIATNFVLEKLKNAGIEVVTDKELFEKILSNNERLQKMKATNEKSQETIETINSIEVANDLLIESTEEKKSILENVDKTLVLQDELSAANMFSFEGLNYVPVRNFKTGESRDINSKHRFNGALLKEPTTTKKFLTSDFYNAAGKNGNADIFYCVQQGTLCFPGTNGIYILSNKFNKNKKGQDEFLQDYDAEINDFRNKNEDLLKKLNNISFEEKNDKTLMKNISEVLEYGEIFNRKNETLGDVRIRKGSGVKADGILHIAERRLSKKVFHEKKELEQAFRETAAIIFCAINNVDKVPAVKETDGHYATYKNGIKTVLKQDSIKSAYIVTGFDLDSTNKEATDTIEAVIANYGYTPEFLGIYAQVGAAYASLYQSLSQSKDLSSEKIQHFIQNSITYGFTFGGKIYLNPDVINSETAVHEYTHLWDAYTQRTNPKLWQKGKDILSKTHLWNEVKNDSNYADIADDDDLILSECHSRICGKIAGQVLEKIAKENGEIAKDAVINWDKETWEYIYREFESEGVNIDLLTDFIKQPMVDLMNGHQIGKIKNVERNEIKTDTPSVDYVLEQIQEAGIEVSIDKDEFESKLAWLNEVNIALEMLDEEPIYIQKILEQKNGSPGSNSEKTVLPNSNPQINNRISPKKMQEFCNALSQINAELPAKDFLNEIKKSLNMSLNESSYCKYNFNGKRLRLRISEHNANVANSYSNEITTSIVIKITERNSEFRGNSKTKILYEFAYPKNITIEQKKM